MSSVYTERLCAETFSDAGDHVLFVVAAIPNVTVLRDLYVVVNGAPSDQYGYDLLEHQLDGSEHLLISGNPSPFWFSSGTAHWRGRQRLSEGASFIARNGAGFPKTITVWATGYVFR